MIDVPRFVDVQGVRVPTFIYGTAWKEQRTAALVAEALAAGFRGFDTANQRKHYHEAGVGAALGDALARGDVTRAELFVQTKFTYPAGQDHRLPYDPHAPVAEQVAQSCASSLAHLQLDYLDSLLLHGPAQHPGLSAVDLAAWEAMEELQRSGRVKLLGVSNVDAAQVEALVAAARIKPAFVQNRCFARLGWDRAVRAVCRRHGIVYQGFSLLTANEYALFRPAVRAMAAQRGVTIAQLVFRFAQEMGVLPLTGTTNPEHMREDLAVYDFVLEQEEMQALATLR